VLDSGIQHYVFNFLVELIRINKGGQMMVIRLERNRDA